MPHLRPRFHGFVQTNQGVLRTYSNPDPHLISGVCTECMFQLLNIHEATRLECH